MNVREALMQGWKDTRYFRKPVYPTAYNLTEILTAASKFNPLFTDLSASIRPSIFDKDIVDIRIHSGNKVVCGLSAHVTMKVQDLITHLGGEISKHLTELSAFPPEAPEEMEVELPGIEIKSSVKQPMGNPIYPKPVVFDIQAYAKFFAVIDHFTALGLEVAFYGLVTETEDEVIIEDVDVPVQSVYGTSYTIPAASLYGIKFSKDRDWESCNCMLHSHANMPVFFSGVDMSDLEESFQGVSPRGLYLSVVGNKRRELVGKLFCGKDRKCYDVRFLRPKLPPHPFVNVILPRINGGKYGMESCGNLPVSDEIQKDSV